MRALDDGNNAPRTQHNGARPQQQRATCSVEMSALSETRKWSTTPTNLLDLSRLSVAGADDGASRLDTNPERERCMRTARSWLTGSLFFVRKPVTE